VQVLAAPLQHTHVAPYPEASIAALLRVVMAPHADSHPLTNTSYMCICMYICACVPVQVQRPVFKNSQSMQTTGTTTGGSGDSITNTLAVDNTTTEQQQQRTLTQHSKSSGGLLSLINRSSSSSPRMVSV
jgi:hypothetical protein